MAHCIFTIYNKYLYTVLIVFLGILLSELNQLIIGETMAEFEKIESEVIEFGEGEFLEICRKRKISKEGEEEVIAIEKGFLDEKGNRRYRNNLSIPEEDRLVDFLVEKLPEFKD